MEGCDTAMDRERRTLIVNEIEYWRRHKLLPEQYCDFLLNLYRDPEDASFPSKQERARSIAESSPLHWLLGFGTIASICYICLHFISFPPHLQIALLLFFVTATHAASIWLRERRPLLSYLFFGMGALALLAGGAYWLHAEGVDDWAALAGYVAFCACIWIVYGLMLRIPWVHFSGWAGLLLVYALTVHRVLAPASIWTLELCWVPLSFLFGWAGWALGRRANRAGAVCLLVACIVWFAPEIYALLWPVSDFVTIQALIFGKLASLGGLAFALRKKWTEWVV
jgi:hypothetical protein